MNLSRIDRVYGYVPVTATRADKSPATLSGVDFALLEPRTTPDETTAWLPATYTGGRAWALFAGPDADPSGAQVVPSAGADLWMRVVDAPEVQAVKVDRITVA